MLNKQFVSEFEDKMLNKQFVSEFEDKGIHFPPHLL